jgi:hypothetical protein
MILNCVTKIAVTTCQLGPELLMVARKAEIHFAVTFGIAKSNGEHDLKLCKPLFFIGRNSHFEMESLLLSVFCCTQKSWFVF